MCAAVEKGGAWRVSGGVEAMLRWWTDWRCTVEWREPVQQGLKPVTRELLRPQHKSSARLARSKREQRLSIVAELIALRGATSQSEER